MHVISSREGLVWKWARYVAKMQTFLCFVDRASRYNCVKKTQPDAQPILSTSIFRQPLRVSGVSKPIIKRHNRMYTIIGTYYFLNDCLLSWLDCCNPTSTSGSYLKRISTNCCIHTIVPPDDGLRYARNM
jgi:hypothetical protein